MRLLNLRAFVACYDNEPAGDDAAAKAAADAAAKAAADAAGKGGGGGDDNVRDQNHLNSVLKREKEKMKAEREAQAKKLEQFQQSVRLTEEQNQALTAQIEELRAANMTVEEQARRNKEKADKEWGEKLKGAEEKASSWQRNYTDFRIGYEINAGGTTSGVIPQQMKFAEAFLRPNTRLVEDVDEDGKPTGTFTAKVKLASKDSKTGKPIVLDLSVPDAFKAMKEQPEEYGYLFEAHTKGGLGSQSGTPGKKPNVAKMSTAEYIEARRKNPNLVYGE